MDGSVAPIGQEIQWIEIQCIDGLPDSVVRQPAFSDQSI
jgi:hypothetical protein